MGKKMIRTAIVGAGSAVAAGLMVSGKMEVGYYTVVTPKLNRAVRLAVVSDLHGHMNGTTAEALFTKIQDQTPDAIVLPGDIVDDKRDSGFAYTLLDQLGKTFACYYVTGNHELRRKDHETAVEEIRRRGIHVLNGDTKRLNVFGQQLEFSGADAQEIGMSQWREQLSKCEEERNPERFSIHLCHRPNYPTWFQKAGFDLVISGHAHGGQIRLPGTKISLIAPQQGLLPKYTSGLYELGDTQLAVSRGLSTGSWPRIFNPPELMILDLLPKI